MKEDKENVWIMAHTIDTLFNGIIFLSFTRKYISLSSESKNPARMGHGFSRYENETISPLFYGPEDALKTRFLYIGGLVHGTILSIDQRQKKE